MLGVRDKFYKFLNLDGVYWYDVYTIIINLFLEKNKIFKENPSFLSFLNRKYLKTFIMTVNYNSGKRQCLINLLELLKSNNLFSEAVNYSEFVNSFHDFLNNDLFVLLYINKKSNFIERTSEVFLLDDAKINLQYHDSYETKEVVKIGDDR